MPSFLALFDSLPMLEAGPRTAGDTLEEYDLSSRDGFGSGTGFPPLAVTGALPTWPRLRAAMRAWMLWGWPSSAITGVAAWHERYADAGESNDRNEKADDRGCCMKCRCSALFDVGGDQQAVHASRDPSPMPKNPKRETRTLASLGRVSETCTCLEAALHDSATELKSDQERALGLFIFLADAGSSTPAC